MTKKRALLSVSDKTGIIDLARALHTAGYELISTGGTATLLAENNLPITSIEAVTSFPECMDGRLKTLHPAIFGGLLCVWDNPSHKSAMDEQGIGSIDIVVCNLYPFRKTVESPGVTLETAIENIDVGGPSMIRAAAKNHKFVTVITSTNQYEELTTRVDENTVDADYRFRMAAAAFQYTAAYDAYIADYLHQIAAPNTMPETLTITFDKHPTPMRYGENPHQEAAYYTWPSQKYNGIEAAELLHGKPLSFNNIADAHAALALAREFETDTVCVAVKHGTPCGVAVAATVAEAYTAAHDCDPESIFGGIVCFNKEIDEETAKKMHEIFLEVIIAPSFSDSALNQLTKKKNIRLLALENITKKPETALECKSVGGGLLVQESDSSDISAETHTVVTEKSPEKLADLIFAMKVVKHVKSNAIVVAKNGRTLGLGGGEVRRSWAAEQALTRAGEEANGAVLASDALFPFADVVELCAKHGVVEIIQPGGSINDKLSIEAANKHGMAMIFTGVRHFKH